MSTIKHTSDDNPPTSGVIFPLPRLRGATSAERLGKFLSGGMKLNELTSATGETEAAVAAPARPQAGDLLCFLLNDTDKAGLILGTVSMAFVARQPARNGVLAGVALERSEAGWAVRPALLGANEAAGSDLVVVKDAWLRVLCELVWQELGPLVSFVKDLTTTTAAMIVNEAEVRCGYFTREGSRAFFSDREAVIAWEIAASWPRWEESGMDQQERLHDLVELSGAPIPPEDFDRTCGSLGLSLPRRTPRRGKGKTAKAEAPPVRTGEPSGPAAATALDPTDEELRHLRDWSVEQDETFSLGGKPTLTFDLDPQIVKEFPEVGQVREPAGLIKKLWWWKGFFPDCAPGILGKISFPEWTPDQIELFQDNWEWSAFLYEVRARYEDRFRWPFFGKPWVKLNNSQRGVLACIWPVSHVGRLKIRRALHPSILSMMPDRVRLHEQVDLNMPEEDIIALVKGKIEEERNRRGLSKPGPKSRRSKSPSWRALQLLDRRRYLKETLNSTERGMVTKVFKEYKAACQRAGIAP